MAHQQRFVLVDRHGGSLFIVTDDDVKAPEAQRVGGQEGLDSLVNPESRIVQVDRVDGSSRHRHVNGELGQRVLRGKRDDRARSRPSDAVDHAVQIHQEDGLSGSVAVGDAVLQAGTDECEVCIPVEWLVEFLLFRQFRTQAQVVVVISGAVRKELLEPVDERVEPLSAVKQPSGQSLVEVTRGCVMRAVQHSRVVVEDPAVRLVDAPHHVGRVVARSRTRLDGEPYWLLRHGSPRSRSLTIHHQVGGLFNISSHGPAALEPASPIIEATVLRTIGNPVARARFVTP